MIAYKLTKKRFLNTVRRLAKQYEADEICKAARLAEVNSNSLQEPCWHSRHIYCKS